MVRGNWRYGACKKPFSALVAVVAVIPLSCFGSGTANADSGWIAVANSPNHESKDWGYGPDIGTAQANALTLCAQMEHASDCRVLASSTDCIGTAWDMDQPINQLHAVSGGGPDIVRQGAMSAAGPYANDPEVRCSWWR